MKDFKEITYPKSRFGTFDVGVIGRKKHHVACFLEIDITPARQKIKEKTKSGEKVNMTSWLIKVIGNTIADNRYIHSLNYKKRKQILFENVDISMPIERTVNGMKVPLAMIIREVNKKSLSNINDEIESAKTSDIKTEKDYVIQKESNSSLTRLFFNLPQFIRLFIWKNILKNPFSVKKNMGTAIVTNIGMTGKNPGWILPKSVHNLCFGLGAIVKKPWVVKNEISIREIFHLTILFDHDVVDGAPAAQFTNSLVKNIEKAIEL